MTSPYECNILQCDQKKLKAKTNKVIKMAYQQNCILLTMHSMKMKLFTVLQILFLKTNQLNQGIWLCVEIFRSFCLTYKWAEFRFPKKFWERFLVYNLEYHGRNIGMLLIDCLIVLFWNGAFTICSNGDVTKCSRTWRKTTNVYQQTYTNKHIPTNIYQQKLLFPYCHCGLAVIISIVGLIHD